MTDRERWVTRTTLGVTRGDPDLTLKSKKGRLSTASLTYVDLVEWVISSPSKGIPREISISALVAPTKLRFRLAIDGVEAWTGEELTGNLSIPLLGAELGSGILVQILSTDGTTVEADGAISGGTY